MNRCLFLAAAILLSFLPALAFDIAIYHDPLSEHNDLFLHNCRYGYPGYPGRQADSLALFPQSFRGLMDSTYDWYQQLGVNYVMVNYIYPDNFNWIPSDSGMNVKVLNWNYPGQSGFRNDKYVDAQYRDVFVGQTNTDQGVYWSLDSSIRSPASRTSYRPSQSQPLLSVVAISGSADTLWRATSYLGNFVGWDYYTAGWADDSIHMPMHYRLTWAVDPEGAIDTLTPLADFYWIVNIPTERRTLGAVWWRYPVQHLVLPTRADTGNWIVTERTEPADTGWYTLLDANFDSIGTVPVDEIYWGSRGLDALDDVRWNQIAFRLAEVRMSVWYRGTHNFYLNRIEVYDEGAWRMFAANPDTVAHYENEIFQAFNSEMTASAGKLAGWYYDEWDLSGSQNGSPVLRSILYVNKILTDHNLPPFIMNGYAGSFSDDGWARNLLHAAEETDSSFLPVEMNEFYFLTDSDTCQPFLYGWPTMQKFVTDTSSDIAYISSHPCGTYIDPEVGSGPHQQQYSGRNSLQAGIDAFLWDCSPSFAAGNMDFPPQTPLLYSFALEYQVRFSHAHNKRFWALLQGGQDNPFINDPNNCCPERRPEPNEVKLGAWLAVACDADGIMWYPWDFGGLLEWTDANRTDIRPSNRFAAAKTVCNKIQRLAPFLDDVNMEFVRTYASRAFETNYGTSDCTWVRLDELHSYFVSDSTPYRPKTGEDSICIHSYVDYIHSEFEGDPQLSWNLENPEDTYVQVSRFDNANVGGEDYWFLIVNRRALSNEKRRISLGISNVEMFDRAGVYLAERMIEGVTYLAPTDSAIRGRQVRVELDPGEAEFVHFFRGAPSCDTTLAHIDNLTIRREGDTGIRLHWGTVTRTDSGDSFAVDRYHIYRGDVNQFSIQQFTCIDTTADTTFLDQSPEGSPRYYVVQACGCIVEGQRPIEPSPATPPPPKAVIRRHD